MRRRLALWLLGPELDRRELLAQKLSQDGYESFGKEGRRGRVFWNGYLRGLQSLRSDGL